MTRDAKIGLLLGLFFIFAIAFIINGMPGSSRKQDTNELTKQYLDELRGHSLGLASQQRQVAKRIDEQERDKAAHQIRPAAVSRETVRYQAPLPTATTTAEQNEIRRSYLPSVDKKQTVEIESATGGLQQTFTRPKLYIVQEGDNLSVIAQKLYGPKEGNRKANIDRIFQANRKILKSPDAVFIGQELVIPALSPSREGAGKVASFFGEKLFEKVSGIGRRSLALVSSREVRRGAGQGYVVKEGDSLWSIAAQQLGDGARYVEIAELNADILDDEDRLCVGMRLKLPGR